MTSKKNHMKKGDSLRIEFHVRVKKPASVDVRSKVFREAIVQWVETGIEPNGMEIEAVTWTRPGSSKSAERGSGDLEAARENMLRRIIHAASWSGTATE